MSELEWLLQEARCFIRVCAPEVTDELDIDSAAHGILALLEILRSRAKDPDAQETLIIPEPPPPAPERSPECI